MDDNNIVSEQDSIDSYDSNKYAKPTEQDIVDINKSIKESIYEITNNFPNIYEDYNFDQKLKDSVYEEFESFMSSDDFDKIYEENYYEYFTKDTPVRSYTDTFNSYNDNNDKIKHLTEIEQPEQRTPEWYKFRHNHITASNAWKCMGNEKNINSIVYEKLKPLNLESSKPSFNETPLSWGQKFEDISVMLYEKMYNTKVIDLGCLPHPKYDYLAASPDGLVVSEVNNGRLLEIKNVVSREITQIPKMDYWIQMQLQMEVCDLDECDFLETKFIEINSYNEFIEYNEGTKGIIMTFMIDGTKLVHKYNDIDNSEKDYIDSFMDENMKESENSSNIVWIKNTYWKLEKFSCIFVPRNKKWFEYSISKIKNVWDIIHFERNKEDGPNIELYKPAKRTKISNKTNESEIKTSEVVVL